MNFRFRHLPDLVVVYWRVFHDATSHKTRKERANSLDEEIDQFVFIAFLVKGFLDDSKRLVDDANEHVQQDEGHKGEISSEKTFSKNRGSHNQLVVFGAS